MLTVLIFPILLPLSMLTAALFIIRGRSGISAAISSITMLTLAGWGGAIYNEGGIRNIAGDFIKNYIDGHNHNGGAIYNSGNY